MIKSHLKHIFAFSLIALAMMACRHGDEIFIPEKVEVSKPEYSTLEGFYMLNEGNMGGNKCTLDYYNYSTGIYTRNIYGYANPSVPKELGDVGNDIAIYGSRLYAVVNCSNKVEVMNAATAERIGQIDIPNCRYIKFHDKYAYVTSYAGPVEIRPDYAQRGFVAKVDTATLEVVDRCIVGFQPDDLEIVEDKIYVANSGGYMVPNYENTLSVISLESFKVQETIPVAINLQYAKADSHGQLWVSSRGDYYDIPSRLYCYDTRKRRITASLDVPVGDMCIQGDSIYVVAKSWSYITMSDCSSFAVVDVNLRQKVKDNFITDGTEAEIITPYGVMVDPFNLDIYVTDAKYYVNPGNLHCYDRYGKRKWTVRTGDIPAHMVFYGKRKKE